ncbi:hypothetical protein QVD17_20390 [Tagetes erecta]|uniref:Uncharacterized protein n=1 Tax=Tagetes erecta TaxID=13708 RepID=A0AAD8KLF3_TARER|nr:hypothetical protein QVD17_20390 [Tagetes erecta]
MGSHVHASMLAKQGLMSVSDRDYIIEGLDQIEKLIERGEFVWRTDGEDEDKEPAFDSVETIIEMLKKSADYAKNIIYNEDKIEKALPAAGHLDPESLLGRNVVLEGLDQIEKQIESGEFASIQSENAQVSTDHFHLWSCCDAMDKIVSHIKHLQRAQPVLLQHHILAYVEQLERDAERLHEH